MEKKFFPLLILLSGINFSVEAVVNTNRTIATHQARETLPNGTIVIFNTTVNSTEPKKNSDSPASLLGRIHGTRMGALINENNYKKHLQDELKLSAVAFALPVIEDALLQGVTKENAVSIIKNGGDSAFAFAASSLGTAAIGVFFRWIIFGNDDFKKNDSVPETVHNIINKK